MHLSSDGKVLSLLFKELGLGRVLSVKQTGNSSDGSAHFLRGLYEQIVPEDSRSMEKRYSWPDM